MPGKKQVPVVVNEKLIDRIIKRVRQLTNRELLYAGLGALLVIVVIYFLFLRSPAAIKVNGQGISRARFQALLQDTILQTRQNLASQGLSLDPKSPMGAQIIANIRNSLVEQQVNNLLLFQEAQSRGFSVSDDRVNAQVNILRAQAGEKNFRFVLKQKGLKERDVREDVKVQLVAEIFLDDLIRDIVVKEKDAREYYGKYHRKFERKDTVKVRNILLQTRKDAEECLKEISGGADFADVARRRTREALFAASGGLWGYRARGEMPREVEDVAFSLSPGKVSDIIEGPGGFYIIKVEDFRAAGPSTFAEAKDEVADELLSIKQKSVVGNLLDDLRRKAIIEVNL